MSSTVQRQLQVWVPSDKDLAMLGRQRTGWCTLSRGVDTEIGTRLTQEELDAIKHVIFKAETLERAEQIRLSLLKLQCDQICSAVKGDGATTCVVCAKALRSTTITSSPMRPVECLDCKKAVCSSCTSLYEESSGNQVVLCRMCFTKRELWKKSGAWFTNALPTIQILNKGKQQWLAGQLQQYRSPSHQLLPRQSPQPSPGKQNVLTSKQELHPSNPAFQISSQPARNTSTLGMPATLTMIKERSTSPTHSSGDKIGQVKWLAKSGGYSDSDEETALSPSRKTPTSIPKHLEKTPPSETDSVITRSSLAAAGPEEENSFSFDIYMSVGNTQNS